MWNHRYDWIKSTANFFKICPLVASYPIKYKHTPGSLLLKKCYEGHIHDSDLLNLIPWEPDLKSTPFSDETIITYDIELPPSGKNIGFNLLDDEDFTIPYITDTIPNSPDGHQLPSQAKRNVWIVDINGEEPITAQGVIDELNHHQTPRDKSNIKISLWRRKSHQRKYLEWIISRFDQVRPMVSHLEVRLPKKPPTPKNIGDALGGPQRQFYKEVPFSIWQEQKC